MLYIYMTIQAGHKHCQEQDGMIEIAIVAMEDDGLAKKQLRIEYGIQDIISITYKIIISAFSIIPDRALVEQIYVSTIYHQSYWSCWWFLLCHWNYIWGDLNQNTSIFRQESAFENTFL